MLAKNKYAILIDDCQRVFASFGHKIDIPVEFLDPTNNEIMETPIILNGVSERFDQQVLLNASSDLQLMEKTLANPLTGQPADSFRIDTELKKKIDKFVTGMVMLAGEFKAKQMAKEPVTES